MTPRGLLLLVSVLGARAALAAEPLCGDCNLVLVALDAVQAAHVSHLGNARRTTPALDALAKQGTSFQAAISPASWTVPTYLSVFTSTFPSTHGLTNRWAEWGPSAKRLSHFPTDNPGLRTLAQLLRAQGFRTGGFTGDSGVSRVLGYDSGFETYTDERPFGGLETSLPHALEWLAQVKDERFFLFVHGYDAHGQYALPADYRGRFLPSAPPVELSAKRQAALREAGLRGEALDVGPAERAAWRAWYDGKVADADERLGQLVAALERLHPKRRTVLVVFSDHGTEQLEHGRVDHGHSLYDELVRVPLVFRVPGLRAQPLVRAQVSTLDVLPTALELLGVPVDDALAKQLVGRSLVPALRGQPLASADAFVETDYRNAVHLRGLRSADGWKYVLSLDLGSELLFDLAKDPGEQRDLSAAQPARAAALRQRLLEHVAASTPASAPARGTGCLPVYQGQCE